MILVVAAVLALCAMKKRQMPRWQLRKRTTPSKKLPSWFTVSYLGLTTHIVLMAEPSALTKPLSVAQVEEEVVAALVVVEATILEAEEVMVEEVDMACISAAQSLLPANRPRRWRRLRWWS